MTIGLLFYCRIYRQNRERFIKKSFLWHCFFYCHPFEKCLLSPKGILKNFSTICILNSTTIHYRSFPLEAVPEQEMSINVLFEIFNCGFILNVTRANFFLGNNKKIVRINHSSSMIKAMHTACPHLFKWRITERLKLQSF